MAGFGNPIIEDDSGYWEDEGEEYLDEDDMSPLEYARFHRLTTDYRLNNWHTLIPEPLTPDKMRAEGQDSTLLIGIDELASLSDTHASHLQEKWNVDRESATFLASIVRGMNRTESVTADSRALRTRGLRLEEALLPTDPVSDLLHLKERNTVKFSVRGEAPFELDETKGENAAWTVAELDLPTKFDQILAQEKLDVNPEVVVYLRECYQPGPVDYSLFEAPTYEPVTITPMTPPLLPLSPKRVMGHICGPVAELQLTSTPEDLIAMEAAAFGDQILRTNDLPTTIKDHKAAEVSEGFEDYVTTVMKSPSSPCARKRLRDLQMDVPILPTAEPLIKRVKTVSFPNCLHEVIPALEFDNDPTPTNDAETDIVDILTTLAKPAISSVQGERLVEADTTLRLPVPEVDDVRLSKPRERFYSDMTSSPLFSKQVDFLLHMKHDHCRKDEKWAGASKMEKQLPWTAFPSVLGKIKEEIFDDGSLARYISGMSLKDDIDVDALVTYEAPAYDEDEDFKYLQPVPAVLEDSSPTHHKTETGPLAQDIAALNPAKGYKGAPSTSGPTMSMSELLQKRKVELEIGKDLSDHGPTTHHAKHQIMVNSVSAQPPSVMKDHRGVGGLSSFFRMHGQSVEETTTAARNHIYAHIAADAPGAMTKQIGLLTTMQPENHTTIAPIPPIIRVNHPMSVVISSTLIARRELLQSLQKALPTLNLIERAAYTNTTHESGSSSYDTTEADVSITPSTGIILTTLQKLKQKPLPGQKSFFRVQNRISSVQLRYAKLVVLVSEGRQDAEGAFGTTTQLDSRDTDALADLAGGFTSRNTKIQVIYVPGGDPQVVQWIAALISRHQQHGSLPQLLEEETVWERLLRQAGLNAFAAQAILAELKQPQDQGGSDDSNGDRGCFGLAAFVRMTVEQRRARLRAIVQSDSIFHAVSLVLDGPWLKR